MLATYHMKDPIIFYNKEDVWEIPMEIYASEQIPVVPYYEVLALPGQTEPEFALILPFSPLSKTEHGFIARGAPGRRELREAPHPRLPQG